MFDTTKQLFRLGKRVYDYKKAERMAEKIVKFISPLVDEVTAVYFVEYKLNPSGWDLNSPSLVRYLGYLSAIFICARRKLIDFDNDQVVNWLLYFTTLRDMANFIDGLEPVLKYLVTGIQQGEALVMPFCDSTALQGDYYEGYELAEKHFNDFAYRGERGLPPYQTTPEKMFDLRGLFDSARLQNTLL